MPTFDAGGGDGPADAALHHVVGALGGGRLVRGSGAAPAVLLGHRYATWKADRARGRGLAAHRARGQETRPRHRARLSLAGNPSGQSCQGLSPDPPSQGRAFGHTWPRGCARKHVLTRVPAWDMNSSAHACVSRDPAATCDHLCVHVWACARTHARLAAENEVRPCAQMYPCACVLVHTCVQAWTRLTSPRGESVQSGRAGRGTCGLAKPGEAQRGPPDRPGV